MTTNERELLERIEDLEEMHTQAVYAIRYTLVWIVVLSLTQPLASAVDRLREALGNTAREG